MNRDTAKNPISKQQEKELHTPENFISVGKQGKAIGCKPTNLLKPVNPAPQWEPTSRVRGCWEATAEPHCFSRRAQTKFRPTVCSPQVPLSADCQAL